MRIKGKQRRQDPWSTGEDKQIQQTKCHDGDGGDGSDGGDGGDGGDGDDGHT